MKLTYIPREKNQKADALAKMGAENCDPKFNLEKFGSFHERETEDDSWEARSREG